MRGFVVPRETEGLATAKIEGKTSPRITQNADITLAGVRVPDENRLSGGKGTFVLGRWRRCCAGTRGNASWACHRGP